MENMKRRLSNWCVQRGMFNGYMIVAKIRKSQQLLGVEYKLGEEVYLCTRNILNSATHWDADIEMACVRGGFFLTTLSTQAALEDWAQYHFKDDSFLVTLPKIIEFGEHYLGKQNEIKPKTVNSYL